jgi:hypothetical protein
MKLSALRSRFFAAIVAVAAVLSAPFSARADYDPAVIAADARWVVHADFNSLRDSPLGKELIVELEKAQKGATAGLVGVNIPKLLSTVGRISVYGVNFVTNASVADGTIVAQGTADLRKIVESLLLQGTLTEPNVFAEITDLGFPAYSISEPDQPAAKETQLIVAFPPEPVIIASKNRDRILKARDVIRGTAPSLAKTPDAPINRLAANARGAYLFAASSVPAEIVQPPKALQTRILQLTQSGALAIGQRGADHFARLELAASSGANAEKLAKILEGLTSLLSLSESNDKQLAEFLQASRVTRQGDVVTLELEYPTARLMGMVTNLRTQLAPVAATKAATRPAPISIGTVLAEWTADSVEAESDGLAWRTIENVELRNGMLISLGRTVGGGRTARFDRLEIVPAGGGAPLTFRSTFMRSVRPTTQQIVFPGADGTYTLRVAYPNDPDPKTRFAVSVQNPAPPPSK